MIALILGVGLLGACTSAPPAAPAATSAAVPSAAAIDEEPLGDLLDVEVVLTGLAGPTQIALHPDGRLLVAEIGEGEGTPTGTVTAIDLRDPADRDVLVEGLDTPTGLSVADGRLWIMERTRLVTAPLEGGPTTVVFDDLPNNGRSEGTLTTLVDGTLLFDTSGRRMGFDPAPGSGTLWAIDPTAPPAGSPEEGYGRPIIEGMKHAYATAELEDGRLLVTEMSDGRFDGQPAADELLLIDPGEGTLQGGWPRCVGDGRVVEEFEGSAASCAAAEPSLAVFPPGATPTGVAVAPWDPETALVTQWTRDRVLAVPIGTPPQDAVIVVEGISTPQHLLVVGDRVLLTSHAEGRVLALSRR